MCRANRPCTRMVPRLCLVNGACAGVVPQMCRAKGAYATMAPCLCRAFGGCAGKVPGLCLPFCQSTGIVPDLCQTFRRMINLAQGTHPASVIQVPNWCRLAGQIVRGIKEMIMKKHKYSVNMPGWCRKSTAWHIHFDREDGSGGIRGSPLTRQHIVFLYAYLAKNIIEGGTQQA